MKGRLLVGTSGWSYDDWVGRFYPAGLNRSEWLPFYARHFPAVEINMTFYRLPFVGMITGWSRRAPEGFVFVAKGSRVVTHRLRLRGVEKDIATLYKRLENLKGLEVVLWQLPPSLRADAGILDAFLALLQSTPRSVVEFRHPSWWDNEEVLKVLRRHGVGFCGVSHPRLPGDIPDTADFVYVRFHGLGPRLYDYDYSEEELLPWVEKVAKRISLGQDAYVFFNNDFRANAVFNARHFQSLLLGRVQD